MAKPATPLSAAAAAADTPPPAAVGAPAEFLRVNPAGLLLPPPAATGPLATCRNGCGAGTPPLLLRGMVPAAAAAAATAAAAAGRAGRPAATDLSGCAPAAAAVLPATGPVPFNGGSCCCRNFKCRPSRGLTMLLPAAVAVTAVAMPSAELAGFRPSLRTAAAVVAAPAPAGNLPGELARGAGAGAASRAPTEVDVAVLWFAFAA
jgi:hypothetical protein